VTLNCCRYANRKEREIEAVSCIRFRYIQRVNMKTLHALSRSWCSARPAIFWLAYEGVSENTHAADTSV